MQIEIRRNTSGGCMTILREVSYSYGWEGYEAQIHGKENSLCLLDFFLLTMPTYELALLLRVLPKATTAGILKRSADTIFEQGGIIRKINNLGSKALPCKTSKHGSVHKEASYFVFEFDVPPASLRTLKDNLNRDVDVIRNRIFKAQEDVQIECTLEDEMKPAPYRPEVIKMLDEIKKDERKMKAKKFSYNTGLDYYPFQK